METDEEETEEIRGREKLRARGRSEKGEEVHPIASDSEEYPELVILEPEETKELSRMEKAKLGLKAVGGLVKAYVSSIVEYFIADLTCKYGTSWMRPILLWIILVLLVFPSAYFLTHGISRVTNYRISIVNDFPDCLYFSIATATTLGYGDLHPVGIGKVIAPIEAVFGTFMWAVFLAVFARKYMR